MWLSRIRTYIGNTDLDPGAMILAKITTFFALSLRLRLFSEMLFVATLEYFEKDGTAGSEIIIPN
jgi:hypothetical protein